MGEDAARSVGWGRAWSEMRGQFAIFLFADAILKWADCRIK